MKFTAYIELECEINLDTDTIQPNTPLIIKAPICMSGEFDDDPIICYGDLPQQEKAAITRAYQVALQAEVAKHRDDSIN
jgi:hypothetical protein